MADTPNIRFRGFTDDWEERKLSNIAQFDKGQGYSKNDLKEHGAPIILYGRLYTKYETKITNVDTFVDVKPHSVYSQGREVIVPASGETAQEIARASAVEKSGILLGGDLNIIIPDNEIDPVFLALSISNGSAQKELVKKAQGKSVVHIHNKEIKDLVISFPKYIEQQKISSHFDSLDHLITFHQRKCDETKELKKYMLRKMFPQNGKKIPEIRFAGFTDDWEQRKCGDVFTESRETGHSGDVAKKLTVRLWGKGVYAKSDKGSTATQYYIRHAGQFIYSKLDFLNSAFGVVPEELDSFESTADLPAFDCHGINPYFMYYKAVQPSFYITNGIIADGSRRAKRIHADTFLNMPLMLPSKEEQDKIASFFQQLDDVITLHQHKCDELKEVKKFMLQNMFPKKG